MTATEPTGPASIDSRFVDIDWRSKSIRIEHQWVGSDEAGAPVMVFLHEGLGSVSMWKDFPQRLCGALGCRGLVYSRPGYGRSAPRGAGERWLPDFMHRQAHEVLPALLQALGIVRTQQALRVDSTQQAPWLFGHSDGGSIALLHAARWPQQVAGCIVLAPHILVQPLSIASIEQARQAYLHSDLRQRLTRHHDDPDSAFWGWNGIWLDPAFRAWRIDDEIAAITAPVLAVQGVDDEYGTLEQIIGIARRVPQTQLLALPDCGHSPHRDQPDVLIAAVHRFFDARRS